MDYRQIPSNSLGHALYRDTMFCIIDSLFVCRVSTFDRFASYMRLKSFRGDFLGEKSFDNSSKQKTGGMVLKKPQYHLITYV